LKTSTIFFFTLQGSQKVFK